ncbi:MAG TPA: RluA family pseudouridine synthase [Anseongella sp.]
MVNEQDLPGQEEDNDLYEHHRLTVDPGQSLLRIDKFLTLKLQNVSRNRIQNAADAGSILVNGKTVRQSYRVKPGDVISIVMAYPPRDTEVYPENIPLDIVYEDEAVLVVNKQAGMVVHPGYNNYTGTLVNALLYHVGFRSTGVADEPHLPELPGNQGRPGLVHRIDKDTSGLLLVARQEVAMTFLAKQFFEHSIQRSYLALVWGDLEGEGTISGYIGRSRKDRRYMQVFDSEDDGKWSVTHYRVLERFTFVTLIECRLETGRTHQIRAHMKHVGHPLFGDASYGGTNILKGEGLPKFRAFVQNCFQVMPRQALHAQSLGFVHPASKKPVSFEADLPPDFSQVLGRWRKYVQAGRI